MTLARPARHILPALLLGALATFAAPRFAHAEEQPTAEQLEQAKKAYAEGKAKFEKGNFGDAVEKFKESYRLSKNPLLLFNIAVTFERLQQNDMALFYYKKFLSDAPEGAAQRADAKKSVAALEKAGTKPAASDAADAPPAVEAPPEPEAAETTAEEAPADVPARKKRPAAECVEADVEHQIVEDAPPGKPLDLTASVPEECGWTVTLFYRGAGDDKFLNAAMRPRYRELVGRIPAAKMSGNAVQYYVEIKATDGALVKRIGKSTSPNVVYLDEAAQPRFYPDLDESGGTDEASGRTNAYSTGDEEDPLAPKGARRVAEVPAGGGGGDGVAGGAGGGSFVDVGTSGFNKAKWITTGVGGGMLVLSVTFYAMASSWGTSLEGEANASQSGDCPDSGGPPCRTYDDDRKAIEATGRRYETFYKVSLAVGVVASGVAGYLWWKEKKSGKKADRSATTATGLRSIVASPVAGDDFIGGAAALRF